MTFLGVLTVNLNAVLAFLGSNLLKLDFRSCKDIDLGHFLPFLHLEDLNLDNNCSTTAIDVELIQADAFLPNLKNISSEICLGKSSRLFEEKSTLTKLNLCCSHIGIAEASSCLWDSILKLWANVESLSISSSPGLSIPTMCQIVSQLEKLKRVEFAKEFPWSEEESLLIHLLKEKLLAKKFESYDCKFSKTTKSDCQFAIQVALEEDDEDSDVSDVSDYQSAINLGNKEDSDA